MTPFFFSSDRMRYPTQTYELAALLKRAFVTLSNLESLNIDCDSSLPEVSLEILDALRLPSLRTFRIEMSSIHAPSILIDFLSNHPRLKDIELITNEYGDEEPEVQLTFPDIERFTAPLTYWDLVLPNQSLQFAGVHQVRFSDLDEESSEVFSSLKEFTGLKSVRIAIPAEKTTHYLTNLKDALPALEELSLTLEKWRVQGEPFVGAQTQSHQTCIDSVSISGVVRLLPLTTRPHYW